MNKKSDININPKVLEYIDKGITNSTKKAYNSDWEDFEKFCKLKRYQSLPAKYETIGEYLVYLSDDKKRKVPSQITKSNYVKYKAIYDSMNKEDLPKLLELSEKGVLMKNLINPIYSG